MAKSWTAYVQQDGDNLILPLPDDLLEELDWKIDDVLVWDIKPDGTVTLTKKKKWWQHWWQRYTDLWKSK